MKKILNGAIKGGLWIGVEKIIQVIESMPAYQANMIAYLYGVEFNHFINGFVRGIAYYILGGRL